RAMPCWSQPAARCASWTAARSAMAREIFWSAALSPRATSRQLFERVTSLVADQTALHGRPVPLGGFDGGFRIAGKSRARFGAIEEIKPLPQDQPQRRMSRRRGAARQRHRIVAAEAWRIHIGSGREGRTVAF